MIYEFKEYRGFLKSTLSEKIAKNPSYSLRAMSKQVGLAPSTLSEVIQGKKKLSFESGIKISQGLNLNQRESDYFITLVQLDSAKSSELKMSLLKKIEALSPHRSIDLSLDIFRAISEWHHIPMLEMTYLNNFNFSAQSIAKKLGISKAEADSSIDRLERLELIEKIKEGKFKKCDDNLIVKSIQPNNALRIFHKQMLKKAIESIDNQTPQEKIIGSETLAFDSENLAKANEIIEECFERIVELSNKSKKKNSVYHLGIQFFNLAKGDI